MADVLVTSAAPATPTVPSVRRRFAFTLVSNLLRSLLSFVTGLLVAKWLGPTTFGSMAFLLGTFGGVRLLLDLGTSTAFFTFLSQQPRSKHFVRVYYAWLATQFVVPALVMAFLLPAGWIEAFWPGQERWLVVVAFAAAYMQNSVWPVVQQAGEAQRRTVTVQAIGLVVVAVHLVAVALLWLTGTLGLYAVLGAVALEHLIAAVVTQRLLADGHPTPREPGDDLAAIVRKYGVYCLPLIPYAVVGFAQEFADKWLLQTYGGAVQQAYYAVGAQFAAIALLATTAILRILWKEVAEAHHQRDHERAYRMYSRVSRVLFLVGAAVAGMLIPWSADLLRTLLGPEYAGGAAALAIMFLYPIHQSIGQVTTTVLYATERVTLQVMTGVVGMLVGLAGGYLVLAPRDAAIPGLGLASVGLAVKMVAVQMVFVNVLAFLIARLWRQRFDWAYQPVALVGCLGSGWLAAEAARAMLPAPAPLVFPMALAGVLHLALVGAFVWALPFTAGTTRDQLGHDARAAIAAARAFTQRF